MNEATARRLKRIGWACLDAGFNLLLTAAIVVLGTLEAGWHEIERTWKGLRDAIR